MDVNAALEILRRLARETLARADRDDDVSGTEIEFAETFEGLDGWIGRGGFLPGDWQR